MNRALLTKCVYDASWLLAALSVGVFAFCWIRVWLVSTLDTSSFEVILNQVWDRVEQFSPVQLKHLLTYTGRIAVTYDDPLVVMCVTIWAIARGSDVVSGELGRGTLEMLLAQPLSRATLLWTQSGVTIAGLALIAAASWAGVFAGVHTNSITERVSPQIELPFNAPLVGSSVPLPFGGVREVQVALADKVNTADLAPAVVNLFCLGFFLAGVATLMSAWDRYRWRTIAIVSALFVVSSIMKVVGMGVKSFGWLLLFTFFTSYEPQAFVQTAIEQPQQAWSLVRVNETGVAVPGPLGHDAILFGLGLVGFIAAAAIFQRRDLPAPL